MARTTGSALKRSMSRCLRRLLPQQRFAAALREAEYLGLPLDDRVHPDGTRSHLEADFLSLCRRHRLPQPEVNVRVDRFLVDVLWRDASLIAEVDGWRAHGSRSAFEGDRARDVRLQVLGYAVVRFTRRAVRNDAREVARTIRILLERRAGSVGGRT